MIKRVKKIIFREVYTFKIFYFKVIDHVKVKIQRFNTCKHVFTIGVFLMGKKVKVTLTIDGDVVNNAKQIGLNLSQFCESALINAIKALKPSNSSLKPKIRLLSQGSSAKKVEWTGGDLNPSHSGDITRKPPFFFN